MLVYEDVPDAQAGVGEALIELRAASLNHLDLWIRKGLPSVPKPRILGADGAGIVRALGPDTEASVAAGDRVVINPGLQDGRHVVGEHRDGTHAELIAIPVDYVHRIPGDLSFEEAAAFPLISLTAFRMLVVRAEVKADEWVLVWGAGSGVSAAAIQIAHARGARVLVASSDDSKLERVRELGAIATVNHTRDDVVATVRDLTDGAGADVVVDHVGEATWSRSLAAAGLGGRIVVCGATSGPNPPANLPRVWWKELSILGSTMGDRADFTGVLDLVAAGSLRPTVDTVFPLASTADAHRRLESGDQFGKVVVSIG